MDKSPCASYLHTNYSPTASEILEIKDFLAKPLARLNHLEDEINRLNAIIEKLCDEHEALNAEIEAHRALISPLRRMPLDIMVEIFTHCLPTEHNAVMSTREAPLLLGRVCSEWRSITLSTPRLWASLHILSSPLGSFFGDSAPDFEIEKCRKGAEEWIRRSGECPLSLSLHIPSPIYHFKSSVMQPFEKVLQQILPSSKRWKDFNCRGRNDSFTHFRNIAESDVPMMESLGITIVPGTVSEFYVETTVMDISGLLSAPKLRKLSLTSFRENLLSLPVRWSQLTQLTLNAEDSSKFSRTLMYSQVGKVLKNCLQLVSCSLRLGNTRHKDVQTAQLNHSVSPSEYTFTLPLLWKLCLIFSDKSDEVFLKYLDLPVLRHLEMSFERVGWRNGPDSRTQSTNQRSNFMGLLEQHGHKLKHLALDTRLPITSLYQLKSTTDSIIDEVVDRLTPSDETPDCLCPVLEEFRCKGSMGASFSEARLLSFVEKRCVHGEGSTLKRVGVALHRNEPEDLEDFLISLDSRIECGDYLHFEELDNAPIDARIFVRSKLGEGLAATVVDIQYAQSEPEQEEEEDHTSESLTPCFILRI